jgi:putative toxin-antitoxin system antitoxin component (TIGR02293 family)
MLAEVLRDNGYHEYRARLHALLEIPELASDFEIHTRITHGFAATWLVKLTERGVLTPVERDQIIPLRTLKTRIERDQPLTVDESDRLFRSAHITAMAEAVFGEADKAKRWLSKPKERFLGADPDADAHHPARHHSGRRDAAADCRGLWPVILWRISAYADLSGTGLAGKRPLAPGGPAGGVCRHQPSRGDARSVGAPGDRP